MKISSVSKKVLASALSAAMVVAFAPTVAMGASEVAATNTYENYITGQDVALDYYDIDKAFAAAVNPSGILSGNPAAPGTYDEKAAIVKLAADATLITEIHPGTGPNTAVDQGAGNDVLTVVTVDLNGKTLTSNAKKAGADLDHEAITVVGTGTIAAVEDNTNTTSFSDMTVGTEDKAAEVTFDGGTYNDVVVAANSSVKLNSGDFAFTNANADTVAAFQAAVDAAKAAGANVTITNGADANTVDAACTIAVRKVIASIGDTTYPSLASAFANATVSDVVVLQSDLADAAGNFTVYGSPGKATLDLNGHALERATIVIAGNAELTVKGEGKLVGVSAPTYAGSKIVIAEGAKIAVETSAKDTKKGYASEQKSTFIAGITVAGELTVADTANTTTPTVTVENGGSFAAAKGTFGAITVKGGGKFAPAKGTYGAVTVQNGGHAVIADGTFASLAANDGSYVTVNGGTITGGIALSGDPKANLTVTKATIDTNKLDKKFVAEGSVQNLNSAGNYEIGAPVATAQVSSTAEDGTKYTTEVKTASLAGAIVAASEKTTVTLAADVEEAVNVGKELTIDLAGHTVKGGINVSAAKKVTIKGGSVVAYGTGATGVNASATGAEVTLESGTFSAEEKLGTDGKTKLKPSAITAVAGGATLKIKGGTFKNAVYPVAASAKGISGGTFDKKPTALADKYVATQNEDKTWTVALGDTDKSNFVSVNGFASTDVNAFKVADVDKALEKAVDAAYEKALTAAWSANPTTSELAGFEFNTTTPTGTTKYTVNDFTKMTGVTFALEVKAPAAKDVAIKADKDYELDGPVYTVKVAVKGTVPGGGTPVTVGYLSGIAIDVVYTVAAAQAQDTASYTYGFVGGANAKYDAEKKAYSFSTTSGAQFAPERISNSILELQEQMKQIEIAAQDKAAANSIKGTAKTIKTKKGVTAKKYTVKVKTVTSESGAKATYKKANTAGKSKITVAKSGTITIKKGLKKGTYKVKVKGTVGASSKTVTAKIVIK